MADIEMSEEQKQQVARAQAAFAEFKSGDPQADAASLELMFHSARSMNGWQDRPVSDELLRRVYDIAKMGATSMNGSPARLPELAQITAFRNGTLQGAYLMIAARACGLDVFVRSPEGKEKIKPTLMPNNVDKVMTAPLVAIIGHDEKFYERMDLLFPHAVDEAKELFGGLPELAQITAFRNGTLQGAYLMIAARACGLDCGPMSGFDNKAIDEVFFAGTTIKSNFLCGLGYGDAEKIFQRLPRLPFQEACRLA